MILKNSNTKMVFFFLLFLIIIITTLLLTKKSNEPTTIQAEIKKENDIQKIKNKTVKIDLSGKNEPFIYTDHKAEIDKAIKEKDYINTAKQENQLIKNKDGWEVDYGVGLEDGAIENIKSDKTLTDKMINGKIEFSKSF